MDIKFIFLWTDILIYGLVATLLLIIVLNSHKEHWIDPWRRVARRKLGMIALVFLLAYTFVGLADSIHFRLLSKDSTASHRITDQHMQSLLDVLIRPLGDYNEKTYSAPFAIYLSAKTVIVQNGVWKAIYPRLEFAGRHLPSPQLHAWDVFIKSTYAILIGLVLSFISCTVVIGYLAFKHSRPFLLMAKAIFQDKTEASWREVLMTVCFIILVGTYIKMLSPYYHLLGTDKIGGDILYQTIKSIRTGLVIGTLTTLIMLPFAIFFGCQAGYFGGWRDDIIQYIYTTLSSVPSVLLISASVLSLQIFIANHPLLFPTLENRADARLLALCIILGITSWTSLCRLLRAETLKLREMDYVKAAIAMGIRNLNIIWRHITPNVLHIILITAVLDFSSLVLAEAVLSYVGVGVDPITPSWGNMINSARLDLAREPVVWWPLFAAFIFMFILVLSANLFADAVRDAFDPRLRHEF